MKRILFVHSCRSDWALIEPLIAAPHKNAFFAIASLSYYRKNCSSVSKQIAENITHFESCFENRNPDFVFIPGDRFEVFSAAIAASHLNIPIIHAYGGEKTIGSQDDIHRDCITAMAKYHFTAHEKYSKRVAQIKGSKENIWTVGSILLDGLNKFSNFFSPEQLRKELRLNTGWLNGKPYVLFTYHPDTTKSQNENLEDIAVICQVIETTKEYHWIITSSNNDFGGKEFNKKLETLCKNNQHAVFLDNNDRKIYLSLMKWCDVVVGNSSSGIMEAPFFAVPSVDIGDRQTGRIKAKTVFDTLIVKEDIIKTIKKACQKYRHSFSIRDSSTGVYSLYGNGYAAHKIIEVLHSL